MDLKIIIKQNTLCSADVHQFINLSVVDFLQQLEGLDIKILNRSYIGILREYLIDLRNDRLDYKFVMWLADDFHNLPFFIANDLAGFSAEMFWGSLGPASSEYTRAKFIECLWSMSQGRPPGVI